MISRFFKNIKPGLYRTLPVLFMAPAILLGIVTMYFNNVAPSIWLQNFGSLIIIGILSYFILSRDKLPKSASSIVIAFSIVLLTLTFVYTGSNNVHRYLSLGIISLNIGSIVLPILLIELERILSLKNWWMVVLLTLGVIVILFFQPDASKVTAFSIATLFFLGRQITRKTQYVILSMPVVMSILSWFFLDELPPVAYVEGILSMTRESRDGIIHISIFVIDIIAPTVFSF